VGAGVGRLANQSQQVNLTVDAGDAGAGVATASLRNGATVLDSDSVPAQSRPAHDGLLRHARHEPAALGDGSHTLDVVVADAAGEVRRRRSRSRSTPALPARSR
jgi:hypothetical protein